MMMRNLGAIGAMVVLGACGGGNETTATTPTNASATAPAASSAPAETSSATATTTTTAAPAASSSSPAASKLGAEGATCGGIAGIQCQTGLKCVMTGPTHPDQAGTCKKP